MEREKKRKRDLFYTNIIQVWAYGSYFKCDMLFHL